MFEKRLNPKPAQKFVKLKSYVYFRKKDLIYK